jgi:hypothetical protein
VEVERTLGVVDEICEKLEKLYGACSKGKWDDYLLYRSCRLILDANDNLHEARSLIRKYLSYARQQKGEWEQLSLF